MALKVKKSTPQKLNPKKFYEERKSLLDNLTGELEEKGVEFFRPKELGGKLEIDIDYLTLPKDITEVDSKELGKYLNAFTQQKMYMRTLVGWQEIVVEEAKRDYYLQSHELYSQLSLDKKLSETAKERIINNSEEFRDLFIRYKDEKRKLDLLNYNLMSIEDAIFTISREISRRGSDWETDRRNYNVNK